MREESASGLRWTGWFLTGASSVAALVIALRGSGGVGWLAAYAVVVGTEAGLLWAYRSGNRPEGSAAFRRRLGPANTITLARGILLACLAGHTAAPPETRPWSWAPFVVYAIAAAADGLDGYVARRTRSISLLGANLDMELDGLGILIAVLYCLRTGVLPWPFVVVGLLRYGYVASLWILRTRGVVTGPLTPSVLRRRLAGLQMGLLAFLMIPGVDRDFAVILEAIVGGPLTLGFIRDWLVVSGFVDRRSPTYRLLRIRAKRVLIRWFPLALRVLLIGSWVVCFVIRLSRPGWNGADLALEIARGVCVGGLVPRRSAGYCALGFAAITAVIGIGAPGIDSAAFSGAAATVYLLGPGSAVDLRRRRSAE